MLHDLCLTGPIKLSSFLEFSSEDNSLVWSHLKECDPPGKEQRWSTSVTLCVLCALGWRLEVGPLLRAKNLQHWSQIVAGGKNRAPCFLEVLGGNEVLGQQKPKEPHRSPLCAGKWESSLVSQPDHSLPHFFTVSLWMLGSSAHRPNASLQTVLFK